MQLVNPETRSVLESLHPEALQELTALENVLDSSSLGPELLALCQSFFRAQLAGNDWSPGRELTPLETDCLSVCEQFMVSVATLSDEQLAALGRHLSADDLYNLMYAIYVIEGAERLTLMMKEMMQ